MPSVSIPGFLPSTCGFPFANSFEHGTPVLELPTPFGSIPIGNAGGGVCGGMVFAALDLFTHAVPPPATAEPVVFQYLCHRLVDSFNLPFGVLKYYDWQRRPDSSRFFAGVRVQPGITYLTVEQEWPKIRATLDAGQFACLGLVKAHSFLPTQLGRNHQVLAYGYELDETTGNLTIAIYDPNYPGDDGVTLSLTIFNSDDGKPVLHSREGDSVRGIFLTEYRAREQPPAFAT